jgi:hypothetical protein
MYRHDRPAVFTHKLPGKNNSEDLDVDGSISKYTLKKQDWRVWIGFI